MIQTGFVRGRRIGAAILWLLFCWLASRTLGSSPADADSTPQSTGDIPANYVPAAGPYSIGTIDDLALHDQKRDKDLRVKLTYPTAKGPFPVLIFSHGYGGSKNGYSGLTSFWAERGYVTIQPDHADAYSLATRTLRAPPAGKSSMEAEIDDPSAWMNRVLDVTFILDSLTAIQSRVPALRGNLDSSRIGMGGHSFGAFTTMLIGGAAVDIPGVPQGNRFADPRPGALLVISGQGRGGMRLTDRSWQAITRPMMVMTGSRDRGLKGQPPDWRKEPYEFSPPGDKYLVFIQGASHMTFTGRPAEMGREPELLFDDAKQASLAFWDAYLKHDTRAKEWLVSRKPPGDTQGGMSIDHK
jgi:predicted dienelactone hydrolase